MPLLDDVADYLEAQSIGHVGVDIFPGKMPDQPNACIALYELPGFGPDPITTMERPGIKIRIRDSDTDLNTSTGIAGAMTKAYAIKKLLHRKVGITLSGVLYHRIDATGNPGWIGQDQRGRNILDLNFIMCKEEE